MCSEGASYEVWTAQSTMSNGWPAIDVVRIMAGPKVSPMGTAGMGCCLALSTQSLPVWIAAGRRCGQSTRTRSPADAWHRCLHAATSSSCYDKSGGAAEGSVFSYGNYGKVHPSVPTKCTECVYNLHNASLSNWYSPHPRLRPEIK
jgi:hypothetical protein